MRGILKKVSRVCFHLISELYQIKVKFEVGVLHALEKCDSGLKKRSSRIIYKTLKFPDVTSHKALWISNAVAFSKHFSELCVNQSVTDGLNFSPNTQEPKKSGGKSALAEFNLILSHSKVSKQCLQAFLKLKPYYF